MRMTLGSSTFTSASPTTPHPLPLLPAEPPPLPPIRSLPTLFTKRRGPSDVRDSRPESSAGGSGLKVKGHWWEKGVLSVGEGEIFRGQLGEWDDDTW